MTTIQYTGDLLLEKMTFSDPVIMVQSIVSAIRNKYSEKERITIEKSIKSDFNNAKKQKWYKNVEEMFKNVL